MVMIKDFNGDAPKCVTIGKEYQVITFDGKGFDFIDDEGDWVYTSLIGSWVLNGGDWMVCKD